MDVKRGLYTLDEVSEMVEDMLSDFKKVEKTSTLKENVERDEINEMLLYIINGFNLKDEM